MAATLQQLTNVAAVGVFSVVLARSVTVEQFGIYSYAITLSSIVMAVGMGGIYGLGIKRYLEPGAATGQVTLAILFVRECATVIAYVAILLLAAASGSDSLTMIAVAVAGLAAFGKVLDVPDLWFQATMTAYIAALCKGVFSVSFFVGRIMYIGQGGDSITVLVWVFVVEYFVTSCGMFVAYLFRAPKPAVVLPTVQQIRTLARESLPLWLSTLANQLNLRVGVIVLQIVAGAEAVAYYSAAARVTDVVFALPMAYATATFAVLIGAKRESGEKYRVYLQRSFTSACWMGIAVGAVIAATATWFVPLLFGDDYHIAGRILMIQAIASPFIFMSAIVSKWIIAEGTYWMSLGRYIFGVVLNIVLCLVLIPSIGVYGAAIASVVAILAASYLFCFLRKDTRMVAKMMSFAFVDPATILYRATRTRSEVGQ